MSPSKTENHPTVIDKNSRVTVGLSMAIAAMFITMFLYLRDIEKGLDRVGFGLDAVNKSIGELKSHLVASDGRDLEQDKMLIRHGDRLNQVEKCCGEMKQRVRELEQRK